MKDKKATVVPVATSDTDKANITHQWFVDNAEYAPAQASYKSLVNGEEAFKAVYKAIEGATKTVDIVCWGFQPSMYFIRDGQHMMIGKLLEDISEKKGVKVRILGWEAPFNSTGHAVNESNLPGKSILHQSLSGDRKGHTSTDKQYRYDVKWFKDHGLTDQFMHDYYDDIDDALAMTGAGVFKVIDGIASHWADKEPPIAFISRGFNAIERAQIAINGKSEGYSAARIAATAGAPSHHQKTVLVDYEIPDKAVGFLMGHNMLDNYWDTDAHSALYRIPDKNMPEPSKGPRGLAPLQDISCQLTGPILNGLNLNFTQGWKDETGQDLDVMREIADDYAPKIHNISNEGSGSIIAQVLRTQPQHKKEDIKALYLNAAKNANSFMYMENQYFRWPEFAEEIKKQAEALKPYKDTKTEKPTNPVLHLFVVTNKSDTGIGSGIKRTFEMMKAFNRQDVMPNIANLERAEEIVNHELGVQMEKMREIYKNASPYMPHGELKKLKDESDPYLEQSNERLREELAKIKENEIEINEFEKIKNLKIHVCTLVSGDSPAAVVDKKDNAKDAWGKGKTRSTAWMKGDVYSTDWMDVYIHSKLMIVNNVFTTHGSTNINSRSMEVDSEINIAHENSAISTSLRRRLWKLHASASDTSVGMEDVHKAAISDKPEVAFGAWGKIIQKNKHLKKAEESPCASLVEFEYYKTKSKDLD